MENKMKKSIIIATLLVVLIVIAGLISCSRPNISGSCNETYENVNPYSFTGETHNDGLDYILQSIETFDKGSEVSKMFSQTMFQNDIMSFV